MEVGQIHKVVAAKWPRGRDRIGCHSFGWLAGGWANEGGGEAWDAGHTSS